MAGAGIERGLIGPRESSELWSRHLLNCAVLGELVPESARVVDVGTGAGLPGLALAIARPDLSVCLLDAQQRRTRFLGEVIADLELAEQVQIVTGRAEDNAVRRRCGEADVVTARAVAPLDRLVPWCLPFARRGGVLLAIKGRSADAELAAAHDAVLSTGGVARGVVTCGTDTVDVPTRVVVIERGH